MLGEVAAIYRGSKKKKDINWWTEWVCRPPAAVLVYLLKNTRVTPNQVTFLSLFVAAGSAAMLLALPGHLGLALAVVVYELSFVLDCVDGQLARIRQTSSVLGHLLDFLMDEIKALLIFGCVAVRLYLESGDDLYMLAGTAGMFVLASGLMLTSFVRRPEYGAKPPTADGQPAEISARRGPIGLAIGLLERGARVVIHYPSYIWLLAILDRLEIFFWAYAAVNALYVARTFLALLLRLGRPTPAEPGQESIP